MSNKSQSSESSRADRFFSVTGWWYAAAGLVVVLIVGVVLIVALPSHDSDSNTAGGSPSPADAAWSDRGCNGSTGTSAVPTSAPKVEWVPVGGLSMPTSSTYGPHTTDGPVRSCFQHSPTGALTAATVIIQSAAASPADSKTILTEGLTAGPGRDETVSGAQSGDSHSPIALNTSGYTFGACQSDRCQVNLLFTQQGNFGQFSLSMVWTNGDWKIDGTSKLEPTATTTMPTGYIAWSPHA